jgi:CRP-like cAMP-binding protein
VPLRLQISVSAFRTSKVAVTVGATQSRFVLLVLSDFFERIYLYRHEHVLQEARYSMNPFINALHHISRLSEESQQALDNIISSKHYKKNSHLLRIGEVAQRFFFLAKGVGRVYYMKKGHDVTDYFATDNQFIGGVESLFTQQPSHKAIEVLEDSEVYSLNYPAFEKLCLRHHDVERVGRKLAVYAFLRIQKRIESIRFLSVRERYCELEKEHPGITNRVPLKHIASYLGTTQVSISRIRAGKQ